ncbi:UPF0182 family protein [Desulfosarcina sp. OttesenSCG-928-G10]|nr:UPF0182 family protein [Desulfosarcina sp. OttesenSCG-928-G10]MDL2321400.1 UPF0182 family protein [Desulfosarcina sp. OttesenSCG-928-B08]
MMLLTGLVVITVIGVTLKFAVIGLLVDWWWFQSLDLEMHFILRKAYRFLVLIFFTLTVAALFAVNFWIAARFSGFVDTDKRQGKKDLVRLLHREIRRLYRPLSLILALPVAIPMFLNWEAALMFWFGQDCGTVDPLLGKDISFYLFRLPVYHLVQRGVLLAAVMLLTGVAFLYWYGNRLLMTRKHPFPKGARIHISILGFVTTAILCWGIFLERYDILYSTANLPVFFGPGFVEIKVILLFVWLSTIFLMATGISLIYSANTKTGWRFALAFGLLFAMSLVCKDARFFSDNIRTYSVMPNQIIKERDYIEANIRATLSAFGLDQVTNIDFGTKPAATFDAHDPTLIQRLRNIPVWDRDVLRGVYEEIQGIRTYYTFPAINVDRYWVDGRYRQVYIGAREVDPARLPESAQNWLNPHLQYTHGQGVAMVPAAQAGDTFMTWFIKDVPPQSDFGLISKQTAIYYGLGDKPYIIAPNKVGEIGYPMGDQNVIVHYNGTGGIPVGNTFKKSIMAVYFEDSSILLTKTTADSRLLFRRNITEQARHIAPFLRLGPDPYVVTTPEGIFWIQDAFVTSTHYPLVAPVPDGFNYIREAVKIVTDAYNGTVSYYAMDPDEPIVSAYRRMYPGLIKPIDAMPAELRAHIRYPQDLFLIQSQVYAKYHPQDPERFFRQEDLWEISKVPLGSTLTQASPYYLTLDLFEPGKEEFLLFLPMSPFERDNLRALMVAGCDGDTYGKLFVYNFSQNRHVYGPAQTDTVINQDTRINQQFNLWGQRGTEVVRGKMVIEPTEGDLLYIQPVYLQESGLVKIPELKRLIMVLDGAAVMAPSLEEAAVELEAELARKQMLLHQQSGAPAPESAAPAADTDNVRPQSVAPDAAPVPEPEAAPVLEAVPTSKADAVPDAAPEPEADPVLETAPPVPTSEADAASDPASPEPQKPSAETPSPPELPAGEEVLPTGQAVPATP